MSSLREKIPDNRLLRLLEGLLKAGSCEDWNYHPTLRGTPQGGVVSPLLANIYLDQLDKYVVETLIPVHTGGESRKPNLPDKRLMELRRYDRRRGRMDKAEALRQAGQPRPSGDTNDLEYRRLRYIRYADDGL